MLLRGAEVAEPVVVPHELHLERDTNAGVVTRLLQCAFEERRGTPAVASMGGCATELSKCVRALGAGRSDLGGPLEQGNRPCRIAGSFPAARRLQVAPCKRRQAISWRQR